MCRPGVCMMPRDGHHGHEAGFVPPAARIAGYKIAGDRAGRLSVGSLMAAVSRTPVAVGIDASSSVFQQYKSGVFDACGTSIDHVRVRACSR